MNELNWFSTLTFLLQGYSVVVKSPAPFGLTPICLHFIYREKYFKSVRQHHAHEGIGCKWNNKIPNLSPHHHLLLAFIVSWDARLSASHMGVIIIIIYRGTVHVIQTRAILRVLISLATSLTFPMH